MADDMVLQVIDVEGANQLVFAGSANTIINAVDSQGQNRLDGGLGDDTFLLGAGDRVFGGQGSDRFFGQTGGNNRITGGEGADQFWIANNGTVPATPNRITDFNGAEDVIGLEGFGTNFDAISILQQGADALIAVNGNPLALLENIDASQLSAANFALVDLGQNGEPDVADLPRDQDAPTFDALTGLSLEITTPIRSLVSGELDDLIDISSGVIDAASGGFQRTRVFGSGGDDTFIVGDNDRLFGGDGSDRFFIQSGGKNRLAGGAGADQFWVAVGDIPERRNTILDFTDGEDVIGIAGTGIEFAQLDIQQRNGRSLISLDGNVFAVVLNTPSSALSEADFAII
ncbi:MAG: hypothetical protein VKK04_20030 [Synechococcales bacterium]|nr:hypothetical protein [Synechococcales bacterium]